MYQPQNAPYLNRMIKQPPYLKKGDTIGIVCPAGSMPLSRIKNCISTLKGWGYNVVYGKTLGKRSTYFSGTDAERCADFQQMLNNKNVQAILCARGGYGVSRVIDDIDFSHFQKDPKWIIGYSDITVFHAHIFKNYATATLHAPMAAAFNDLSKGEFFLQTLRNVLKGENCCYKSAGHPLNRPGKCEGILVGGNLSILVNLIGTPSDVDTHGKILFVEDIDEYIYQIDRMFVQLKRSEKLDHIAGLILGGFTEIKDTKLLFGKTVWETIYDHVKDFDYPVCFNFPVSHSNENVTLKHGLIHRLEVKKKKILLEEILGN